jgi:hypothetical protein
VKGQLKFTITPGRPMITGGVAPEGMPPVPIDFDLPAGFDDGRVLAMSTPLGPLNVRFEKLRDLP